VKNNISFIFLFLLAITPLFAQDEIISEKKTDSVAFKDGTVLIVEDTHPESQEYDPLAPSRAAFYSAVLPGLGQAYNEKYWKIPIIYAGMATGVYFYLQNDKDYDRFRNAYKRRLAGYTDVEFYGDGSSPVISNDRLITAQRSAQKNKDVSIIVSLAFYLVNIVDANVDSHLKQYNVSEDLSIQPKLDMNGINTQANYGLSLTYTFK
jgi:hypothetical protein